MYRETICFLFGKHEPRIRFAEKLVSDLDCDSIRIGNFDSMVTARLTSAPLGCVIIDVDSIPNATANLTRLFLDNHVWLPIVEICQDIVPTRTHRTHVGALVSVSVSDEYQELARALEFALRRDSEGEFAPSKLRKKMRTLTAREKQSLKLYLHGLNSKSVATNLNVTQQTADKHRGRALRKLQARSLVDFQKTLHYTMLSSFGYDPDML